MGKHGKGYLRIATAGEYQAPTEYSKSESYMSRLPIIPLSNPKVMCGQNEYVGRGFLSCTNPKYNTLTGPYKQ